MKERRIGEKIKRRQGKIRKRTGDNGGDDKKNKGGKEERRVGEEETPEKKVRGRGM